MHLHAVFYQHSSRSLYWHWGNQNCPVPVNLLRPTWNRRHFADDIFKCIFFNKNVLISIKISLKFIPKGPINNISTLVLMMAWCRPGDKPLSEPLLIILLAHISCICVTWPQWVKYCVANPARLVVSPHRVPGMQKGLPWDFIIMNLMDCCIIRWLVPLTKYGQN